jgi:hypothetical protein
MNAQLQCRKSAGPGDDQFAIKNAAGWQLIGQGFGISGK